MISWCDHCGGLIIAPEVHICSPTWRIYCEEFYGDDFEEVRAPSREGAVEKWAELLDALGDYEIVNGAVKEVTVTDAAGEKDSRYSVTGESRPHYRAVPIEDLIKGESK